MGPGPFQRLPTKFQKISDFVIFRVRKSYLETPANISTVQKYGANSFAQGGDMSRDHLSPKQLVSISHATPDLIPAHTDFHLSVPNPKYQNRHAYAWEMKVGQKKCLQMNQKQGRTLQDIISDHFRQLFNQPKSSGTLPTKKKKKKYLRFLSFLEFENRLFNIFSDFLKITEIFKLFCISSGSELVPFNP